jgi:hypothetical protein
MKNIIFWDMTSCSPLSFNRRFGGTNRLHLQGRRNKFPPACLLVFAELISSTLKMEALWSSETSVATQQTTRLHIQEDDTLHNLTLLVHVPAHVNEPGAWKEKCCLLSSLNKNQSRIGNLEMQRRFSHVKQWMCSGFTVSADDQTTERQIRTAQRC